MRFPSLVIFGLLWLVPIGARGDYFALEGPVAVGTAPGGDLSTSTGSMMGLAIVETPAFSLASGATLIDELPEGLWGRGAAPPPATITTLPDSAEFTTHLLHFGLPEGVDGGYGYDVKITFDAEIVAIYWTDEGLDQTDDLPIGAGFLQTAEDYRALELEGDRGDQVHRVADGITLVLSLGVGPSDPIDQIRVITRAESPDADVYIACDEQRVTVADASVTFEADVVNAGTETSLPVALFVAWNPARASILGGSLTYDGRDRTCDGMSPATCGLGQVRVGRRPVRAIIDGRPGETIGVDVLLLGRDVSNTVCHFEGTIPDGPPPLDAGPDFDAGPLSPGEINPEWKGGGGCACEVGASPTSSGPRGRLLFVALGLLLGFWRRVRCGPG